MGFYLDNAASVEKRLNDPRNILSENSYGAIGIGQSSIHSRPDRKEYRKLSVETKGLVAALAQVSGVKETSKALGVHPAVTSRYKHGMSSDGSKPDTELRKETRSVLDSIGVQASNLVQESLARLLNPARLIDAKTPELTQIAGVAMNILEKASPQKNSFIAGRIVFMVPQAKETSDFEIIDVIPTRE
jgi:hypothetical protein